MKKYDVVALGELLIDFVQNGNSGQGNQLFEANPGGAPCNVLSMLSKLGYQTAFIGKVGDDILGRRLGQTIDAAGISRDGLRYDSSINTTLAFVHITEDGDRDFSFYRSPGADTMFRKDEVSEVLIEGCRIFHFGSLSLTDEPSASATRYAVACAKKAGKLISFDPNLRPPLWKDMELAKEAIWYGIQNCDVLKIADNEILWLTGEDDYDAGVEKIRTRSNVKLINVTLGKEGSIAYHGRKRVYGRPYLNQRIVDATGAGDAFCACVLGYVLEHGVERFTEKELEKMLLFANAAASIVTTRKGAICVMPEKAEIDAKL